MAVWHLYPKYYRPFELFPRYYLPSILDQEVTGVNVAPAAENEIEADLTTTTEGSWECIVPVAPRGCSAVIRRIH